MAPRQSDETDEPKPQKDIERRRWPRSELRDEALKPPSPPGLEPMVLSTRQLPPEQQLSSWQTLVEPLVSVRLPDDKTPADGFPADHVAWNFGGMLLVQQSVPAHSYRRSAERLRASAIDHWCLILPRSGRTWTEVDGRVAEGGAGLVEFRSLGHPFRGRATESESINLYLPRERFARFAAALDARNNTVLSGNFADLLTDFVAGIMERQQTLAAEDLPRIVQAISDLLIAGLAPSGDSVGVPVQMTNLALMERARQYIHSNLNVADLAPDDLARGLGISRTRLYQMFEPSGGVLHYIQKRRLIAAHEALGDSTDSRRIIDIAESCGFKSAANFSRAFTKEFGYSPREARNALASPRLAEVRPRTTQGKTSSFENWLKTLGA